MARVGVLDNRPRVGPRLHVLVPRDRFAGLITGPWSAVVDAANAEGWVQQTTDYCRASDGFAAVYEGRPGAVWLASQGW